MDGRPTAYLDEVASWCFDEFNIALSSSSIWRALKRAKWSRKRASKVALEQSQELRNWYKSRSCYWEGHRLVFIDESASNERTGSRKYGWSPQGTRCTDFELMQRSERWSILPAMTLDGWLDNPLIYQGAINAELFYEWLNSVLQAVPIGSIIVMDNASIHRSTEIGELVAQYGCYLEYLPPYSPDLNPIEQSFGTLKAWTRRHYELSYNFEDFGAFLRWAVQQAGGIHAEAQIRSSGYNTSRLVVE